MKHSLLAAALLATTGAAMAQSSVQIFGVIDAGITRISGDNGHRVGLTNSNQSYSRLGFRGTESLGGNLKASFWLEGQLQNDVGLGHDQNTAFTFQRRSTVSLSGDFGEVRLRCAQPLQAGVGVDRVRDLAQGPEGLEPVVQRDVAAMRVAVRRAQLALEQAHRLVGVVDRMLVLGVVGHAGHGLVDTRALEHRVGIL